LGGRCKENHPIEGEKPSRRQRLPECTPTDGLWEEWKVESGKTDIEVIETIKT
jgi:hypothetical protein